MNHHLNLFRFYNETLTDEFLENNLSRAFALCLSNDVLFFNEYVRSIVTPEDYENLFSTHSSDTKYDIDLQMEMSSINIEGISKVYAIAMTTDEKLKMDDFHQQTYYATKTKNITDIWIIIKDIAVVIEVKRTGEDCKAQLYNQVYPIKQANGAIEIVPKCFSWHLVINIMEKILNLQKLLAKPSVFLNDFLRLTENRYPEWFTTKPFSVLPFNAEKDSIGYRNIFDRLKLGLSKSGYELLGYTNRCALQISKPWATEVIPDIEKSEEGIEYISFYIWPGNTKGQGRTIFNNSLAWSDKTFLKVAGEVYPLDIAYHINMSHFNKSISGLFFYPKDLSKKDLYTLDNYNKQSGKWERKDWPKFEVFMDTYLSPEFNWRDKCRWRDEFVNTSRGYFTLSLGFEVSLHVPYKEFKEIDRKVHDISQVALKINKIVQGLENLIPS